MLFQPCRGVELLAPASPKPSWPFLFAPQDNTDPSAYMKGQNKQSRLYI